PSRSNFFPYTTLFRSFSTRSSNNAVGAGSEIILAHYPRSYYYGQLWILRTFVRYCNNLSYLLYSGFKKTIQTTQRQNDKRTHNCFGNVAYHWIVCSNGGNFSGRNLGQ